jgi:REP element-mobilizing transposase RayT
MNNHYHLLVETPEGNLSKGMRQLNGLYAQRFNHRIRRGQVLKYNKSYIIFAHDQAIADIIFRSNLLHHFQKKYYTNDLS